VEHIKYSTSLFSIYNVTKYTIVKQEGEQSSGGRYGPQQVSGSSWEGGEVLGKHWIRGCRSTCHLTGDHPAGLRALN
jgi:hypothetical protein